MRNKKLILPVFMMAALIMISLSCSSISITAVWKDNSYKGGPFKKIVVLALFKNLPNRQEIEDAVVSRLKATGTDAVSSLSFMSPEKEYQYKEMETTFNTMKIDGILIIKLKTKDIRQTYVEGENYYTPDYIEPPYFDYFILHYHEMQSPGYMQEKDIVRLESALFAGDNDKLVWIAETKTVENYVTEDGITNPRKEGTQLAELLFKNMKQHNLIK